MTAANMFFKCRILSGAAAVVMLGTISAVAAEPGAVSYPRSRALADIGAWIASDTPLSAAQIVDVGPSAVTAVTGSSPSGQTRGFMATIAAGLFDKGYRYFKIKVEGDLDLDVARVREIRKRLGDSAHLTIDANQSYSAKDAIVAIGRMSEYRLDLVEQPVHRKDLKGLALVTQATDVTIEADEGAGTVDEILTLATNRIVDAVSLKLPKLGGIRNAIAAARICEACGVKVRLGAHVGTRLLNAHAIHVAAALDVTYACELGEFMRMYDDPFKGIEVVDGHIDVPTAVGCGVTPV